MANNPPTLLNLENIRFPNGLAGLPEWKNFSLHQTVDMMPIAILQCKDEERVSFIVSNPAGWFPTYRFDVLDDDMKLIKAKDVADLIVLAIINVETDPFAVTANMLAPLLINPKSKLGVQVVLHKSPYLARQPLTMKTMGIRLEEGLMGLPEYKEYILQIVDELMPVMLLVSHDEHRISFPVVNPWLVDADYAPKLSKEDQMALRVGSQDELAWFAIVNVNNDPVEITVNLKAPIVVNPRTGEARQVLLSQSGYQTMQPIKMLDVSKLPLPSS